MKRRTHTMADQAVSQQTISGHVPMTHRMTAKVLAFLMTIVSTAVVIASFFGIVLAFDFEFYTRTQESIREEIFHNIAESVGMHSAEMVLNERENELEDYYAMQNISGVTVEVSGDPGYTWRWGEQSADATRHAYTSTVYWNSRSGSIWLYDNEYEESMTPVKVTVYVPDELVLEDNFYMTDLLVEMAYSAKYLVYLYDNEYEESMTPVKVTVYVPDELVLEDNFYMTDLLVEMAYSAKYLVYSIGAVALLVSIACFVFLMCSAGHRGRYVEVQPGWGNWVPVDVLVICYISCTSVAIAAVADGYYSNPFLQIFALDVEVQPGWGNWVPVDVLVICYISCTSVAIAAVADGYYSNPFLQIFALVIAGCTSVAIAAVADGYYSNPFLQIFALVIAGSLCAAMTLGLLMSIAVRFKLGKWWQNSLVYYAWSWVKRLLGWAWSMVKGAVALICKIPMVSKTMMAYGVITLVEFLMILIFTWEPGAYLLVWILYRIALLPVVVYVALVLRKLQNGAKAIAEGDMNYQISTELMLPEFKKHAQNLNKIREGMTVAVEQKLKSERMKTELITNVSHDIKTPLTSIINYSDLIGKEPCDNPQILEYAQVLHRQSDRLKRLIEDLVEASKASTGNLEVHLAPCEVGVMISQTIGEYEQRLQTSQLTLVVNEPEKPIQIMADGRRLWRVFDNLMNNICKYSQPGTRVYLTLEEGQEDAVIIFRNTSRDPLNLSPDELMERFVRGDSARNSEGNGLGLSIARSLTELQKGTMSISIDADLFKVILRFPKIKE